MEALYDELWGKKLDLVQDRTFSIPRPGKNFHSAYKVNPGEIGGQAFPDPKFAKKNKKKVFKMLEVRSKLPCGRKRLLVRQEYERIVVDLVEVELAKWSKKNSETETPVTELSNIDSEGEIQSREFSDVSCETDTLSLDLSDVDSESEVPMGELSDIDCKTKILPAEWSYVSSDSGGQAGPLDFELGGQPGSGKSFFLSYLLVLRLLAGQPTAFRTNDSACYLFDSLSRGKLTDANALFGLSSDQKRVLWILTDGVLTDERWNQKYHEWFVVLAASPGKTKASRQWEKDRNVASRYMSNWGWDEIVAALSLEMPKPLKRHQVAMLFTTFTCLGPIARTCLESILVTNVSDYKRSLIVYLDKVDLEIDTFILRGGFQTVENRPDQHASHRIAVMDTSEDGLTCNIRVATRWIAHKIFEKTLAKSQMRCFELYNQLAGQKSLRTAAGWMFEAYAHDWFRKGGSFEANQLPIQDNVTPLLKFYTHRAKSLNYFTDAKSLAMQVRAKEEGKPIKPDVIGKYFLPYNANFESVDGLVFSALDTLILLQITIAERHDIKLRGVQRLCEALPLTIKHIHIVFVIPEDIQSKYLRTQSVPQAEQVRSAATTLTITQFRLVLTQKIMLSMVVDGAFEVEDEGTGVGEGASMGASTAVSADTGTSVKEDAEIAASSRVGTSATTGTGVSPGAGLALGGGRDETGSGTDNGGDTTMGGTQ